jgi:tetratricopeptide (TPR) repeat protein
LKIVHAHWFKLALFLAVVAALAGCSRKKSGFTHRLYHNTTSHYNWYFNAREILRVTDDQLWANKEEDYLELLEVYVIPDEATRQTLLPQMDEVIEKCSTVIDRHSMEIKKKEHNKWIDDCYLLIGIANYYKGNWPRSEEMTSYVAKKYRDQDSKYEAAVWLARTYIEQERYGKATTVLSVIEGDNSKVKPKNFQWKLDAVYAHMYLRQGRFKEAIPHLEDASRLCDEKRMEARLTYILARAYEHESRNREAIDAYARVVKLKPNYEMEFYAKISQALAFDRKLDSGKIKDMLLSMAKDQKNREYYDQIYYALADIELEEQNFDQGITYLRESIKTSMDNPTQKGKSFLRLAELYFEDRDYVSAKMYYDSTAAVLPEDFPNYETIVAKGESLAELVTNLEIVELNDSLINFAQMDPKDREKKILKMIAELEAEAERKKQEELAALERLQNRPNFSAGSGGGGSGRKFYFYNSSAVSSGFSEFKRRWGDRKLEDNWRRSAKTEITVSQGQAGADADSLALAIENADDNVKSLEEYLAELPLSDTALVASHNAIIQALYDIGVIYKEKLKDDDNAIESFLRITNDYDTSATALNAYYQLYRIYLNKEQSGGFVGTGFRDNSEYYKNVILADYPDSEFAKLISNPDYITAKNADYEAEKTAYESTYKKYTRRQYSDVIMACNTVIQDEPDNNFLSKYYLIKAMTIGAQKQPEAYENVLREIISKFRGTEEADKAAELLGELNKAKARVARDNATAQTPDPAPTEPDPKKDDVNTSMFKEDNDSEHFFALIFPKADDDATTIKETIATFNSEFFRNSNLRVTNSFIDKEHQIIIVRSFQNKDEGMSYYNTFFANDNFLKELNAKGYPRFIITTKNFTTLFRNKNADVYQAFFEAAYL